MTILWLVTGASLLAALVAWRQARRTAKRLDQLSQLYWELKYQHGELRVHVQQLTGTGPETPVQPGPSRPAGETFVPLTALKR